MQRIPRIRLGSTPSITDAGSLTSNVGQQPEKFVVEQIYRETEAGSIIKGIGLPAFINNGGYHQVLIGVYEDGLIDCWGLVTLQEFKEHVRSGWVVTQVPKGAPVSFHPLFSGKCDFECYVKVEELVKEERMCWASFMEFRRVPRDVLMRFAGIYSPQACRFEKLSARPTPLCPNICASTRSGIWTPATVPFAVSSMRLPRTP